jgi:hypothetical protein
MIGAEVFSYRRSDPLLDPRKGSPYIQGQVRIFLSAKETLE